MFSVDVIVREPDGHASKHGRDVDLFEDAVKFIKDYGDPDDPNRFFEIVIAGYAATETDGKESKDV